MGRREICGSNFEALLELSACRRASTSSQPRRRSPVVPWHPARLTACWGARGERERRGSERAREAGVQLCPTRSSTAHCKPQERACAEPSLGQAGGRRSRFLATLINLLRIAPSEGMPLDSPWREDTPLQECWVAAFSHSPKFLGWNKIRGEC